VGSILGRSKLFLSSPNSSDRLWGQALYSMGKGGDITTGKKAMAESKLLSSIKFQGQE
jgi:hypothetical protein